MRRGSSTDVLMCTTLLPPAQWAQMEFALAELGDRRRTHRLVNIATRLAQNPGGTLPQALPDWSELKAAYRFFSQPQNGYEQIQGAHWRRTRNQCRQPGEYLLIEDTTTLDDSARPAREDLGTIGTGSVGDPGRAVRQTQRGMDSSQRVGRRSAARRLFGPQARWLARLANHLAWLATADVDVRRIRKSPSQMKKNVGKNKALKCRAIFDGSFGTERLLKN